MVLVLAGCGSVKTSADAPPSSIDARASADAPSVDAAPARTAVSAVGIAAFNIAPTTFTKIPYDHVVYDDRGELDVSNGRFTASHDGDFEICASVTLGAPVLFEMDLFVDGARERALTIGNSATEGCRTIHLAKGSNVEIWAYHHGASTLTVSNDDGWDWLQIHEVHRLVAEDDITGFTAPPSTFTAVPYGSEALDERNEFDPAAGTFTASAAGDYHVCAGLWLGANNAGTRLQLSVYINGTRERELFANIDATTGCRDVRLAAGDVLDLRVYHSASTTLTIPTNTSWNWLTIDTISDHVSSGDITQFAAPDSTFTRVPYGAVLFDDASELDASLGRFTPAAAGDYEICASMWDGADKTKFELDLFVNGNHQQALGGWDLTTRGCRVLRLATGDHIDIDAWQNSGTTTTVAPNIYWNWLTVAKL